MSELNLTDASAGALADIAAANATPDPTPAAAPVAAPADPAPAAPAAPTPSPAAASAQPQAAEPATPADPTPPAPTADKWVLKRRGQEVEITDREEVRRLAEQGFDYSQKTADLSQQRKAFEQQVAETRAWLANPANLKAYLAQLETVQPPAAPAADPNDVPTRGEVEQKAQALLAETQRQTTQLVNQALLQAETSRYEQEYRGEVNRTISTLVQEKFPILQDVEKVDKLLMDDVAEQVKARVELHPDQIVGIDEVKGLLAKAAEKRADKLQARIREHMKMEAVRAAKVVQQSPEPAGGPPPAPTSQPAYKLGDPRLTDSIIKELQDAFDRAGR